MTMVGLEQALAALPDIGAPDYSDEGMLQYLRAERIVPPYQTRGYKLVELVRIYEAGAPRRSTSRWSTATTARRHARSRRASWVRWSATACWTCATRIPRQRPGGSPTAAPSRRRS